MIRRARHLFPALPVILHLMGAPSAASSQEADGLLERAAERYASLSGFCADYRQTIDVTLLREIKESQGQLCQVRPDHFEMRFSDPQGDRIVADGVDLWVYFPSTDAGQVFRTPLANTDGRFDLHREFLSDPGERYSATFEGRDRIGGEDTYILSLTPRIRSPYVHARIWIGEEDALIRRLEILEESESIRTLDLTNTRIEPSLGTDWFRFEPPLGVQVITR